MADWQRAYEIELANNPTARSRPFTAITPPKYGRIQKVRPNFEEFIPHPAHRKPVPRCQASKKGSGGKTQCSKFAIKGRHLCRTHGGSVDSGKLTNKGRQRQRESVTAHGNETVIKRAMRSKASKERRQLEKIARELGIHNGAGSRGRYFKPSRSR